jgi:superoxide reductase
MHCGNIAVKPYDAGVPLVCCGEKMVQLEANTVDAALEKHVPAVTIEGNTVEVNIGSVDHPMTEEHWIQFICLVTDKGYTIKPLLPNEAPHAIFALAEGETPLKVYEHCNLHGLWVTNL